ncbi:hypothetical protein EYF80_021322 [Liparis tanakae]|uniref:Uncharacterized protein n=1 Tax=Liparis tanakae TaxID=230148 RepID=A0A4Z2HS76_9TELE|nr:hypothetical protein EYF80_021322 [Liparis tanakae]
MSPCGEAWVTLRRVICSHGCREACLSWERDSSRLALLEAPAVVVVAAFSQHAVGAVRERGEEASGGRRLQARGAVGARDVGCWPGLCKRHHTGAASTGSSLNEVDFYGWDLIVIQLMGTKGRRAARRSLMMSRHMCRASLVRRVACSRNACLVFMEDFGLPLFRMGTMSFTSVASELTLVAGLGEVLSSGTSALLGIFRPPYFFQYIQQETQRRHCMFGGPHEYHWADCIASSNMAASEALHSSISSRQSTGPPAGTSTLSALDRS